MEIPNSDQDDHHNYTFSRLSACTKTFISHATSQAQDCDREREFTNYDFEIEDDNDDDRAMLTYMSKLSIESFNDDADEEMSDVDPSDWHSTPVTPRVSRRTAGEVMEAGNSKEYGSENDGKSIKRVRSNRRRIVRKGRWNKIEDDGDEDEESHDSGAKWRNNGGFGGFSGESDQGFGGGLMVITRPKGGRRTLCMDMEEVKACNDLGFELEHERMGMMEVSGSRISMSASTLDTTSSGGNSPIASWRISSPGDDPRDVKARLKLWAQAVALVSTSPVFKN